MAQSVFGVRARGSTVGRELRGGLVTSIANGIGAGFISYVLLGTATGRARQVHPLMWVVAVPFSGTSRSAPSNP